ncbi:MAG: hypothetical protein ACRBI6_10505 [Acidimicrobiales bacterium]
MPTIPAVLPREKERRALGIRRVRTPLWRRLTALISLGSLVVIVGVILAAFIGASAMLTLVLLERAAAG